MNSLKMEQIIFHLESGGCNRDEHDYGIEIEEQDCYFHPLKMGCGLFVDYINNMAWIHNGTPIDHSKPSVTIPSVVPEDIAGEVGVYLDALEEERMREHLQNATPQSGFAFPSPQMQSLLQGMATVSQAMCEVSQMAAKPKIKTLGPTWVVNPSTSVSMTHPEKLEQLLPGLKT